MRAQSILPLIREMKIENFDPSDLIPGLTSIERVERDMKDGFYSVRIFYSMWDSETAISSIVLS